ncbi:hypothetical protein [Cupriavidus sp. Marseille-Q8015]
MAGNALGLELEGLSNEDREFEVARRLVRIGRQAAGHLSTMPPQVPPMRAARAAFLRAARQVAPGLLPAMRNISRHGVAAARQTGAPIFGGPTGAGMPVPVGNQAPLPQGGPVTAGCPSCGTQVALPGHLPQSGHWRRSRNGRAIILFLRPQRRMY